MKTYLVGIDLGTSNCALAYVEPGRGADAPVVDFPVPQLERLGEVAARALLPSTLYLPNEGEFPAEAMHLPWPDDSGTIVGEFARWQGARVPGRLVSSAKSWLCHPNVDRSAAILPWGAPSEMRRISPVEASARLLQHLRGAWNAAHPDAPLEALPVVITVPASFDEVARALTVNAARQAGLEHFTLLEEPQAAFYDFTARNRRDLAAALSGVRLVLVVDVGGGTSDFTLVQVGIAPEGPVLRRIAVGEHLILGGDNMDAGLARRAEERMLSGGRKLSATQWNQLLQATRVAKETLLGAAGPESYRLGLALEGSRLIGGALSALITRAEAEEAILDGFFPIIGPDERPGRASRVALHEMGLPYAADPAITRHLAAFLQAHASAGHGALGNAAAPAHTLPRPDALLLNGGVFNSPRMAGRLREVLSRWWPDQPPVALLEHGSLDLAVARGAAFYGLVREGLGRRITGGAAHALYIGLDQAEGTTPLALCVIPRGQEEGETVNLGERLFQLTLNRPVRFPLFSSTSDQVERAGDVVPVREDWTTLPPIHTVLKSSQARAGSVPVHLRSALTEIGTLELWCVLQGGTGQWRLEFELRGASATEGVTVTESVPAHFSEARMLVERVFGGRPGGGRPSSADRSNPTKEVKSLWSQLERTLGPREEWPLAVLRELWGVLYAGAGRRRRSSDHERIYAQLVGYTLRPGFGYALDEWRCEQTARLFAEGVQFQKEKPVWTEFWVLWRRIAGGLNESRHLEIWNFLRPHLANRVPPRVPKHIPKPKGVHPEGFDEMVRLGAALEQVDPSEKAQFGDWIADRLREPAPGSGAWTWSLGRLGAREPIYGSVHKVVPPGKAAAWLDVLLLPSVQALEGALFAASQIARLTGDRARDLHEDQRRPLLAVLEAANAPASWQQMLREVVVLDKSDRARALGDTLPVGLKLQRE